MSEHREEGVTSAVQAASPQGGASVPADVSATAGHPEGSERPVPAESTGARVVDDVLASLGALDGTDVSTHVSVFEDAHAGLRRALAEPGGTDSSDS